MFNATVENYSFLILATGKSLLALSGLAFVIVAALTWFLRRHPPRTLLSIWLIYWGWLLTVLFLPSLHGPLHNHFHPAAGPVLPSTWFNPCTLQPLDRLSGPIHQALPLHVNTLLLGLWLMIAIWKGIAVIRRRRHFLGIARRARTLTDPACLAMAEHWLHAYRLRRRIRLCHSAEHDVAFTLGVRRPMVFIPDLLLEKLDRQDVSVVIGHELGHVKRLDDLYLQFQLLVRVLLFFNPLLWLSGRRIDNLRESSCDTTTIESGGLHARDYARTLLNVSALYNSKGPDSDVTANLGSIALKERLQRLLAPSTRKFSVMPALLTGAVLTVISVVTLGFSDTNRVVGRQESAALLSRLDFHPPVTGGGMTRGLSDKLQIGCSPHIAEDYHSGVDFSWPARSDHQVHAIADGTVALVLPVRIRGDSMILINHDHKISSIYVYANEVTVSKGDKVRAGQVIARFREDNPSPRLHFELRHASRVLDPEPLFGGDAASH
ncbi:MAG: M23/M56 family metallopeptidase [Porticoccaceae bacterium]